MQNKAKFHHIQELGEKKKGEKKTCPLKVLNPYFGKRDALLNWKKSTFFVSS